MITIKKHLSLKPLASAFRKLLSSSVKDQRRQNSVDYTVVDTALAVLACMFYQSGSLLNYQRMLEKKFNKSNLQTQFGVDEIPSNNQIRTIISSTTSSQYAAIFKRYLNDLQRSKSLRKFNFYNKYLVAIDATQYYESSTISRVLHA